jgi:hypothetical protein
LYALPVGVGPDGVIQTPIQKPVLGWFCLHVLFEGETSAPDGVLDKFFTNSKTKK